LGRQKQEVEGEIRSKPKGGCRRPPQRNPQSGGGTSEKNPPNIGEYGRLYSIGRYSHLLPGGTQYEATGRYAHGCGGRPTVPGKATDLHPRSALAGTHPESNGGGN